MQIWSGHKKIVLNISYIQVFITDIDFNRMQGVWPVVTQVE